MTCFKNCIIGERQPTENKVMPTSGKQKNSWTEQRKKAKLSSSKQEVQHKEEMGNLSSTGGGQYTQKGTERGESFFSLGEQVRLDTRLKSFAILRGEGGGGLERSVFCWCSPDNLAPVSILTQFGTAGGLASACITCYQGEREGSVRGRCLPPARDAGTGTLLKTSKMQSP